MVDFRITKDGKAMFVVEAREVQELIRESDLEKQLVFEAGAKHAECRGELMSLEKKAREFVQSGISPDAPITYQHFAQFAAPYEAALRELAEAMEKMPEEVPTTWLDSLLTGPDAVARYDKHVWNNREVEALLRRIWYRLSEKSKQALASASALLEND